MKNNDGLSFIETIFVIITGLFALFWHIGWFLLPIAVLVFLFS